MSQHMGFEEMRHDGQNSSFPRYEGGTPYDSDFTYSDRQKLSPGQPLQASHRVTIAVVSLLLWMVMFWLLIVYIHIFDPYSHPSTTVIQPLLIFGLVLFTVLVAAINFFFNRKR